MLEWIPGSPNTTRIMIIVSDKTEDSSSFFKKYTAAIMMKCALIQNGIYFPLRTSFEV